VVTAGVAGLEPLCPPMAPATCKSVAFQEPQNRKQDTEAGTTAKSDEDLTQEWWETFSNLFVLFFGSGTFALPWGFQHAGVFGGVFGILGVAGLTYITIAMLVGAKRMQQRRLSMLASDSDRAAKRLHRNLTYATIAANAFGCEEAGLMVMTLTTLSSIGACAGYITFIVGITLPLVHAVGQTMAGTSGTPSSMVADFGSWLSALNSEVLTWLLVWGCLIPFSLVRSFRGLASTTTWGNVVLVAAVAAVLYDGGERFGFESPSETPQVLWWPESPASYTLFLSPCVYLFTVHYCALPMETESHPAIESDEFATENDVGSAPVHTRGLSAFLPRATEGSPLHPRGSATRRHTVLQSWLLLVKKWGKGFDGALVFALLSSALLNAIVGALGYYFYMQGPSHIRDPQTGKVLRGCEDQLCDVVVKNMAPGVVRGLVCLALCLNLALTYVLMLAPSRQYVENAIVAQLADWQPAAFGRIAARQYVALPPALGPIEEEEEEEEDQRRGLGGRGRLGDGAAGEYLDQDLDDLPDGKGGWVPGEGWKTALVRNAVRAALVIFTAYLSLAIPHFGILAGFVGGMTDASQSLVLPPLIYRRELKSRGPTVFSRPMSRNQSLALRWGCLFLAGFGACFIAVSTYSNIKSLLEII